MSHSQLSSVHTWICNHKAPVIHEEITADTKSLILSTSKNEVEREFCISATANKLSSINALTSMLL